VALEQSWSFFHVSSPPGRGGTPAPGYGHQPNLPVM
jgi:hypothetical protein